jgi:predicted Fe-Mo cluster-binding NifX family protein
MTKIKLAIPTDDGEAISRHFGQAKYFRVITLENNQVASSELRDKASHQYGDHSHPGQQMVEAIADCQTLLSGGMGTPAYNRAIATGLGVILTQQISIESAMQAYLAGTLKNEPLLIHTH